MVTGSVHKPHPLDCPSSEICLVIFIISMLQKCRQYRRGKKVYALYLYYFSTLYLQTFVL